MAPWKRVFLLGLSIGAGLAVTLALMTGTYLWLKSWSNLPNNKAITATFESVDVDTRQGMVRYCYVVKNNTQRDYHLEKTSAVLMVRRQDGSLGQPLKGESIDYPVFIPATERTSLCITHFFPFSEQEKEKMAFTVRELTKEAFAKAMEKHGEKSLEFARLNLTDFAGFLLVDTVSDYRIIFPKGW